MNFISFGFMCFIIGVFLYFEMSATEMPGILLKFNFWINWIFIVWASYSVGRIVLDSIMLNSQGQMTSANLMSSMLLAIFHALPTLAISIFMLKEGFRQLKLMKDYISYIGLQHFPNSDDHFYFANIKFAKIYSQRQSNHLTIKFR